MAPGANYMGGKRSAARARSKDTTSRAHKNFFSRQRLEILSNGLSGRAPSRGSSSGHGPRISASDIGLSHARHLAPRLEDERIPVHTPVDVSSPSRRPHSKPRNRSHMRSSSGSRSSKVLEALDTTEPLAMRAAMNKILSIPDLAGLSAHKNVHTPSRTKLESKRSRPADLEPQERQQKRQRSRSAQSCSPSTIPLQDANFDELGQFESMDTADEGDDHHSERENAVYEPASFYFYLHYHETDLDYFVQVLDRNTVQSSPSSSSFKQSETFQFPIHSKLNQENEPPSNPVRHEAKLLPPPRNHPCVSLSSHSAGLAHDSLMTPPSKQDENNAPNADLKILLRDNLYDYQDPWSAIGAILGLEQERRDAIDANIRETFEDETTEILDQPDSPYSATVSVHASHFHGTLSSNSAPRSPLDNHHSSFPLNTEEADHSLLHSPTIAHASLTSQSNSDDSDDHNIPSGNACLADFHIDNNHNFENLQRDATPELHYGNVEPERLTYSTYYLNESNPITPTKIQLSLSPHVEPEPLANVSSHYLNESNPTTPTKIQPSLFSHVESEPLANVSSHHLNESKPTTPTNNNANAFTSQFASRRSSSPHPSVEFSGAKRLPKFTKFPSPLDLKRTAAHISTYTRPALAAIHSPRDSFKSSLPPLSRRLKSPKSRSPFRFERNRPQGEVESYPAAKSTEVETERLFKIDRVACPEAGRNIDDIQDTRTAEEADFRREEGGNAETYAVAPKDSSEISVFSLTILTLRRAMTEY
ncbi:hypothetical protein B0H13DRAFT_2271983 [Mycena leptocephala]|nr:hypothetical protein B0H13DRAFT_2271983 [Mycena leptocephala]